MSDAGRMLDGWHRAKGGLTFAHRWHIVDRTDGRKWVEAECAIGIVINAANIEEAHPGNAACIQCREILLVAIQDQLIAIARAAASAFIHVPSLYMVGREVPQFVLLPLASGRLAQALVKQLPPLEPHA